MAVLEGEGLDKKENAIGFLRFFFAALVIVYHTSPLGGLELPSVLRWDKHLHIGNYALGGFFTLSGFLIARSWTRDPSIRNFAVNRILRIFPGFLVCLLVTGFGFASLWAVIEGKPLSQLWAHADSPLRFLWINLDTFIRQGSIAELLRNIPYPLAVNGSLWTLSHELACYTLVAMLGMAGALRSRVAVAVIAATILAVYLSPWPIKYASYGFDVLSRGALWLYAMFFMGVLYHQWRHRIALSSWLFVLSLGVMAAGILLGFTKYALPFALPYSVVWLAFKLPIWNFDQRMDLSYGLYIYAFPIQQTLALAGVQRFGFWVFAACSFLLTLPLAWVSWTCIERPFLRLKVSSKRRAALTQPEKAW